MAKAADMRAKTGDELAALLLDLRKEQFNLRFQKVTAPQTNTARVKVVRRDIARVKTMLTQKSSAVGKSVAPEPRSGQSL